MTTPSSKMPPLNGKVCIVTGSSTGLGRSIALKLAAEGAHLVVCASRSEKHEEEIPTHQVIRNDFGPDKAVFLPTDLTDDAQVEACISEAVRLGGRLDVLVNNAAVLTLGRAHETPIGAWDSTFALNSRGPYVASRAAIIQFLEQQPSDGDGVRGRIINIGSFASIRGTPFSAAYCASKGAILNLTKALAIDYAGEGIVCNAVLPGYARTEMTRDLFDDEGLVRRMEELTPLWRSSPEGTCARGVANLVAFLASGESAFMTGAGVSVDGGVTAY